MSRRSAGAASNGPTLVGDAMEIDDVHAVLAALGETRDAHERAQRFYVRRGWTPDGTEHRFELVGREIVTLHYRIDL